MRSRDTEKKRKGERERKNTQRKKKGENGAEENGEASRSAEFQVGELIDKTRGPHRLHVARANSMHCRRDVTSFRRDVTSSRRERQQDLQ